MAYDSYDPRACIAAMLRPRGTVVTWLAMTRSLPFEPRDISLALDELWYAGDIERLRLGGGRWGWALTEAGGAGWT